MRSGGYAPYGMALADENWEPITEKNKLIPLPNGKPRVGRYLIPGDPRKSSGSANLPLVREGKGGP